MERQQMWPLIGGALLAIGSFLPWVQAGIFSLAGTSGDGMLTLVGGVIVVALALVKKTNRVTGVIVLLIGLFSGWIVYNVYTNLAGDVESIGSGIYMTGLGAGITLFAALDMMKAPLSVPPQQPVLDG